MEIISLKTNILEILDILLALDLFSKQALRLEMVVFQLALKLLMILMLLMKFSSRLSTLSRQKATLWLFYLLK